MDDFVGSPKRGALQKILTFFAKKRLKAQIPFFQRKKMNPTCEHHS